MKTINGRSTEYSIEDIFLKRYSPRAMSGDAISQEELMTLFEAARWAPSASNIQPWRFIYAYKGTKDFDLFFSFLIQFNKDWCKNAGVLVVGISKKTRDSGKPNETHSFDTGAAWENLALQGSTMGLVVHGMAGYDAELAKNELGISDDYATEFMIAIGKPGKIEELPESLQEREKPSDRKKLEEIIFEGREGASKLL